MQATSTHISGLHEHVAARKILECLTNCSCHGLSNRTGSAGPGEAWSHGKNTRKRPKGTSGGPAVSLLKQLQLILQLLIFSFWSYLPTGCGRAGYKDRTVFRSLSPDFRLLLCPLYTLYFSVAKYRIMKSVENTKPSCIQDSVASLQHYTTEVILSCAPLVFLELSRITFRLRI